MVRGTGDVRRPFRISFAPPPRDIAVHLGICFPVLPGRLIRFFRIFLPPAELSFPFFLHVGFPIAAVGFRRRSRATFAPALVISVALWGAMRDLVGIFGFGPLLSIAFTRCGLTFDATTLVIAVAVSRAMPERFRFSGFSRPQRISLFAIRSFCFLAVCTSAPIVRVTIFCSVRYRLPHSVTDVSCDR